ncbi:Spy/CpxP family protein refolding chaperone [Bordetella genomosp. 11]|nr:Spy/CpxP family protein refolding chaperone [Bordetella genomosp. 11]
MKLRITVLAASLLFSAAAMAQTSAVTATGAAAPAQANARVEQHIKTLHTQLKITPAEEQQWAVVAQTMRDNAMQIDQLISSREKSGTMTALDDLDSYARITQANSDGVKKLAAVFAPLYNAMPDDQKRNADKVFAESHERHAAHKQHKAAPAPSQG